MISLSKELQQILTLLSEVPVYRREGDDVLQPLKLAGDQSAMG